jgi:hypothetical protein
MEENKFINWHCAIACFQQKQISPGYLRIVGLTAEPPYGPRPPCTRYGPASPSAQQLTASRPTSLLHVLPSIAAGLFLAVHRDGRPSVLHNRTKRRRTLDPASALSRRRAASSGDGGLAHGRCASRPSPLSLFLFPSPSPLASR